MKVADYVAQWIATISPRVYSVCGAGAMHLNDAACHHPDLEVMAMHHEQAATFAAEAEARITGRPGVVMVTAGPGGTNAITGVACAYVDSIPMVVVSGQVTTTTMKSKHLRQLGMNELDLPSMVAGITKYAETVTDARYVPDRLSWGLYACQQGRPGPVWIDIPLDVQNAEIPDQPVVALPVKRLHYPKADYMRQCRDMLWEAERPLLIIGNGARSADITSFMDRVQIPVVSSWMGSDLVPSNHPRYAGRMGIFGDRAANLAVQNADLIIAVGTRLSVAQMGHHPHLFAPNAKKVIVDIDDAEMKKPTIRADLYICADADLFCAEFDKFDVKPRWSDWCAYLKLESLRPEPRRERKSQYGVNAYHFVEQLQKRMAPDAVVVTDVGVAFIATMQTLKLNGKQRLFHSAGVSPMGWGFPASIGAYRASNRQTICLTGDGGMMLNLQELQTIAQHQLPIKIFVFANNGYATIRMMQDNHFKRHSISSPETGLSCPDFDEVAKAFGIPTFSLFSNDECEHWMDHILSRQHPMLCVVHVDKDQEIIPRVQSRMESGKFIPASLDKMWPDREITSPVYAAD